MKIDAHQHFWQPARGDYGWMARPQVAPLRRPYGPMDFEPHRHAFAIDRTVLVQAAPTLNETEYMLGMADSSALVGKVVGWIDFENREDRKQLQRLKVHPKFSGVRPMIQDLPDAQWMHRPDVQWAFEAIVELDLTFDALGFPLHLVEFQKLFERYPTMRSVVDHCMKPIIREQQFDDWAASVAMMAATTSVHCKLSGLVTEAQSDWTIETLRPYVRHVIECFGPERVMWGSDWPVLNLNGTYESWHQTANALVKDDERSAIFGGTAQRFYRIV